MKKYLAIGHWAGKKNVTSVACRASTLKNFKDDLGGNGFIGWMVITEKTLTEIENGADVWEMVKKKVTNYRKWLDINDYIDQCLDIMIDKMKNA